MDTSTTVIRGNSGDLFFDRLPDTTRKALFQSAKMDVFSGSGWYLAGGTALALQVGHRQSVDLDFFTTRNNFNEVEVEKILFASGKWSTDFREAGTIYGKLMGAKMSLIAYPFFVPSKAWVCFGTLRILPPSDIAAMKIIAVSQRGRKRDFVDLYWYCLHRESLSTVIHRAIDSYPGQKHNLPHLIQSLTYFDDADKDPMPPLLFEVSWDGVKKFFREEAVKTAKELLGLN